MPCRAATILCACWVPPWRVPVALRVLRSAASPGSSRARPRWERTVPPHRRSQPATMLCRMGRRRGAFFVSSSVDRPESRRQQLEPVPVRVAEIKAGAAPPPGGPALDGDARGAKPLLPGRQVLRRELPGGAAGKLLRIRNLREIWRWRQSSANLSRRLLPCSAGKYREFRTSEPFLVLQRIEKARFCCHLETDSLNLVTGNFTRGTRKQFQQSRESQLPFREEIALQY